MAQLNSPYLSGSSGGSLSYTTAGCGGSSLETRARLLEERLINKLGARLDRAIRDYNTYGWVVKSINGNYLIIDDSMMRDMVPNIEKYKEYVFPQRLSQYDSLYTQYQNTLNQMQQQQQYYYSPDPLTYQQLHYNWNMPGSVITGISGSIEPIKSKSNLASKIRKLYWHRYAKNKEDPFKNLNK